MSKDSCQPNPEKIRAIRESLGITQEALAEATSRKVSKKTIENAEAGNRIERENLKAISAVLGVPYSMLLSPGGILAGEFFEIPFQRWDPQTLPPGALLRADLGIVPFHGRKQELESLTDWCQGSAPIAIRLYTGPGGMGKTRLGIELCLQLKEEGWAAGFLFSDPSEKGWQQWERLLGSNSPLFVVVDYAESHREQLLRLLEYLTRAKRDQPVRILLLARAAGDWWDQLRSERGVGDLVAGPATSTHRLGPLFVDEADRVESFSEAAVRFAEALNAGTPMIKPPELTEPHFDRILIIHMSALAAVEDVLVEGEGGILDYVLRRERRFWREQAEIRGLSKTIEAGIGQTMCAITMNDGVESSSIGQEVISLVPFFQDQTTDIILAVNQLLHACYPGRQWIEPVQPDLLGEHLLAVELQDDTVRKRIFGLFRMDAE